MATRATTKEWPELPISKLAHFSRGISWRKVEESDDGILVVSIPNIKDGRIDFESKYNHYITKKVPKNKELQIDDIIFVGSSGSLQNVGRNAIVKELPVGVAAFASFAFNARPDRSNVDPYFLYYLCNSSQVPFDRYTKRAADGKYNFQLRDFEKNLRLKVPSIPEQKAIAQTLTTVKSTITEQEKLIAKLKELKLSMIQHLFTHGTKGEKTQLTEIGEIPESWKVVDFESLCVLQRGKDLTKSNFKSGDVPVAGSNGVIGFHDVANTKAPAITVGRSGSVGLVRFYNQDIWAHNTALFVKDFKGNDEKFTAYYLEHFKLSSFKGGASVPTLDRNQFRTMSIALPDHGEQIQIAKTLSLLDTKKESAERKLSVYQSLFKTLLHELMSGERRVKDI